MRIGPAQVGVALLAALICTSFRGRPQEPAEVILQRAAAADASSTGRAVVLLDRREVSPLADGRRSARHHLQILVRDEEGAEAYGTIPLLALPTAQTTSLVYVRTILPSGEIREHGADELVRLEGNLFEDHSFLQLSGIDVLQISDLDAGSVIDLEYAILDQPSRTPSGEFMDGWFYVWDDPVLRFEYVLKAQPDFDFRWSSRDCAPDLTVANLPTCTAYTFSVDDYSPPPEESMMPSAESVRGRFLVSSFDSWGDVSSWIWGLTDAVLGKDEQVSEKAESLVDEVAEREGKIERIYDFVSREIDYELTPFDLGGLDPKPPASTLESGRGDCKDQAALLIDLLRSVDIEAYPVVVSTKIGYHIDWSAPPNLFGLDHLIVGVPSASGEWQLLDPTLTVCSVDLPLRMQSGKSWLLCSPDPDSLGHRVETKRPDACESIVACDLAGRLTEDGHLDCTSVVQVAGYAAQEYRLILASLEENVRVVYFPELVGLDSWVEVLDVSYPSLDPSQSFEYSIDYELVQWSSSAGVGFRTMTLPEGPTMASFRSLMDLVVQAFADEAENRIHPMILGANTYRLAGRIDVGRWDVVRLPEDLDVENDVGSFRSRHWESDGAIHYERELRIDVPEIPAEQYWLLFDLVAAADDDVDADVPLRIH